jgi:hypothetical protein
LKASGTLPGGGIATVKAEQDSEELGLLSGEKIFFDKELKAAKVDTK